LLGSFSLISKSGTVQAPGGKEVRRSWKSVGSNFLGLISATGTFLPGERSKFMGRVSMFPLYLTLALLLGSPAPAAWFERGDVSGNGELSLTDPILILKYLFQGGDAPTCLDSADVDDDGEVGVSDSIYLLGFLFLSWH
jgi:hypothetical protein